MRIKVVRPFELGREDAANWTRFQTSEANTRSPFLSPCWSKIIDRRRGDVRVAVVEERGRAIGFFSAQRTSPFTAMGCGAPLCDYEGLVAAPGVNVDPVDLARALKVDRLDFAFVPQTQSDFAPFARETITSHVLDLTGGFEAFYEQRKKEGSSTFREAAKKRRKIERELGELVFESRSLNLQDFEQILSWKRAQTLRTGQPDIYGRDWVRQVFRDVLESESPHCQGYFTTLKARGKLIAGVFCISNRTVAHAWITAYDPELESYSPGLVMWMDFLADAGACGFQEVDFGAGDYRFKLATSNVQRPLLNGYAARPSVSGVVRGVEYTLRQKLEEQGGKFADLPGKAMRRLDVMRGLGSFSPFLK